MIKQENHVYLTIGNKMTLILRILLEISSKLGTTYLLIYYPLGTSELDEF